jgi:hypothetical protein
MRHTAFYFGLMVLHHWLETQAWIGLQTNVEAMLPKYSPDDDIKEGNIPQESTRNPALMRVVRSTLYRGSL